MAPRFAYLDLAVHRDLHSSKRLIASYDLHPAGPGPSYLLTPTDNPFADPLEDEEDYYDEDAQPISFPSLLARDFTAPFSPSSSPVSSAASETETETETDADDDTPPQTPDVDVHAPLPFDHGFDHKHGLVTTTAVGYDDEYGVPSVAAGYDPTPFVAGLPLLDELYLRPPPPSSSPPSSSHLQTPASSSPLCLYDPLWHAAPSSLPSVYLHPAPPSTLGGGVTSDPGRDAQDWDWLVVPARAATGRLSDEDEEYYVSQSEDEGNDATAAVGSIVMKGAVGGDGEEDVVGSGRTGVQTFVTLRSFVPVRVPGRRWLWKNF